MLYDYDTNSRDSIQQSTANCPWQAVPRLVGKNAGDNITHLQPFSPAYSSLFNHTKLKQMNKSKPKPVYTVTAFDDVTATAVYSCLKTLCEDWGEIDHYSTIWKWLRKHDTPYTDSKVIIKKHELIKSAYVRKT